MTARSVLRSSPRLIAPLLLIAGLGLPARAADQPSVPARVDRLEKEMKAVQRKVFPGGSPAFFEPEIAPPEQAAPQGPPASLPINDLSARVSAVERELARITNQLEQDEHRLQILSDAAAKDRAEFDARLKAIETPPAPAATAPAPDLAPPPGRLGQPRPPRARPPARAAEPPAEDASPPTPSAAPTAAAAKPAASGDPAEDGYMAGYQLWTDKRYGEAEAVLAKVAKDYPKHKRASYARNLAGRAELDEGKPATAAQTFLQNYQTDPKGDRAPDSLFYLGQALTQLKKTDNACRVYDELDSVYGKTMTAALKGRVPAARKAAGCKPVAG